MQDLNTITIIGRLTRDAKIEYTQSGTSLCNISIAVNESQKDGENWKEYANFFDVTIWGKQAEGLAQYLLKGKQIAVEGRLHQDRWTDKETNQNRSRVKITAERVQLLGGKKEEASPQEQTADASDNFEDNIPF